MAQTSINLQIRDLRKKLNLTQVEFAKRTGVGLRFLRELESGKTTVRLDKLNQVLDFLGVHLELTRNENINYVPKNKDLNSG
ncbi:MAG: type II toxin-antitoxin system Y4mF family antitoxin [Candidatus Omnitrophota bacterium]